MDEVQEVMSVIEGQSTVAHVQGVGTVKDEMGLGEVGDGDLGDEQLDPVGEGSKELNSKDKSNIADAGKNSNASKARKRTKTGCLSESEEDNSGSPSKLI